MTSLEHLQNNSVPRSRNILGSLPLKQAHVLVFSIVNNDFYSKVPLRRSVVLLLTVIETFPSKRMLTAYSHS